MQILVVGQICRSSLLDLPMFKKASVCSVFGWKCKNSPSARSLLTARMFYVWIFWIQNEPLPLVSHCCSRVHLSFILILAFSCLSEFHPTPCSFLLLCSFQAVINNLLWFLWETKRPFRCKNLRDFSNVSNFY